jgi:hypothetical protein
MSKDTIDIDWILTETIEVTKVGTKYMVAEITGEPRSARRVNITYNTGGRMLFDGEDIETEDFMAYVGLLDQVDEQDTGHPVVFHKEAW